MNNTPKITSELRYVIRETKIHEIRKIHKIRETKTFP